MHHVWKDLRTFIGEAIEMWRDLDPELMAAGLSYFSLFSIAPLLLVVLTLAGHLMSQPKAQELILDRVSIWMTDEAASSLEDWMNTPPSKKSRGAAVLGLFISAIAGSQVLGYMRRILNRVWNIRPHNKLPFWREWINSWAFNLLMLAALAVFLTLSLVLDTLASVLWQHFRPFLPLGFIHFASWVQGINFAVSLFAFCLLFAIIYRFVPDAPLEWEDVWAGALVTSILLAIGKVGVSLYLNFGAFASSYGAASSIFILLLSVYIGADIFIFGSVFTRVYSEHYGSRKKHRIHG